MEAFIHIYFRIWTCCKNTDVTLGAGSQARTSATFCSLPMKSAEFYCSLTDEKLWTHASSTCWVNSDFSALQLCPFRGCPPCQQLLSLEQAQPFHLAGWHLIPARVVFWNPSTVPRQMTQISQARNTSSSLGQREVQFFPPWCNISIKTPVSGKISFLDKLYQFFPVQNLNLSVVWSIIIGFWIKTRRAHPCIPTRAKCITGSHPSQKSQLLLGSQHCHPQPCG